ncbi:MAG: hypothetical protein KAH12_06585, partial [Anaerolineales bacterium]|nr:hypothetical protein [Anaerolineales bacterium]
MYRLEAALYEISDPFLKQRHEAGTDNFRLVRFGRTESEAYAKTEITGSPLDTVTSYFGMRKISLGPGNRA